MSGIKQPVTQVRLTNVSIVRMKLSGHRFELACYKNKILNYRSGIEKDLDEVLQSPHIFSNVSQGVFANKKDLEEAFGLLSVPEIQKIILDKGIIQVSDKERAAEAERLFHDIATIVTEKCINSETSLPYTQRMIEQAIREKLHYSVKNNRTAKSQALEVIKALQQIMPLQRAQMRVKVLVPIDFSKAVKKRVQSMENVIIEAESTELSNLYEITLILNPGLYRTLEEFLKETTKGKATTQIIDLKVSQITASELQEDNKTQHSDEEEEKADNIHSSTQSTKPSKESSAKPSTQSSKKSSTDTAPAAAAKKPVPKKKSRRDASPDSAEEGAKKLLNRVRNSDGTLDDSGAESDGVSARQRAQQEQRRAKKERKAKNKGKKTEETEANQHKTTKIKVKAKLESSDEDQTQNYKSKEKNKNNVAALQEGQSAENSEEEVAEKMSQLHVKSSAKNQSKKKTAKKAGSSEEESSSSSSRSDSSDSEKVKAKSKAKKAKGKGRSNAAAVAEDSN
jgi:ribosome maturation protein SDO1